MSTQSERGYKFYKEKLNSAKLILAPMVDQSELAWRELSRRYGAQVCYTPMLHAAVFVRDVNYRTENFQTCAGDRPLIVQFCSDDADTFLAAAKLVENDCDGIDLNLGCPQNIARRGHYGSFLQDEWKLIHDILEKAVKNLRVPVTAKIRVFDDVDRTVAYAKMIESTGIAILTVHGRTREQKGPNTGLASWKHIKAVKDAVKIPVFANGNILNLCDVWDCLKQTGCDGVMVAEGNLYNPAIFANQYPAIWQIGKEYLSITRQHDTVMSAIKGHMHKICYKLFEVHAEYRDRIPKARTVDELEQLMDEFETLCLAKRTEPDENGLFYWQCQPHIRSLPGTATSKEPSAEAIGVYIAACGDSALACAALPKAEIKQQLAIQRSKRKAEKSLRKAKAAEVLHERQHKRRRYETCPFCANPKSSVCVNVACKSCCRRICLKDKKSCEVHKFKAKFYTKHERTEVGEQEQQELTCV